MQKTLSFLASFLLLSITACPGDTGDDDGSTGATTPMTGGATDNPTSGATDDPTGGAALSCSDYCTSIMGTCTGTNLMYADMASCEASCAGFPQGTAADTSMNTLGCRTYHAGAAASMMMPDVHCVHAGPGGGAGVCGANCEGFCSIAQAVCTGANQQYTDAAACMTECMGFTDDVAYNASIMSGDSLACRLYHLTAASTAPDVHCSHIVAASPVCM